MQHREECQARFASHQGSLMYSPLGAAAGFLSQLWEALEGDGLEWVCHLPIYVGTGANSRAALVRVVRLRMVDSVGRTTQVLFPVAPTHAGIP